MKQFQLFRPIQSEGEKIYLDGSKSISNRLLVIRQISEQDFSIQNLSHSDDTKLMESFFDTYKDHNRFNVHNAGTVARFATAFLATVNDTFILDCEEAMKKRPIHILVDALRQLGADIEYLEQEHFLPLQIKGGNLQGDVVKISADVSSQYISALMMIAPKLENGLRIELEGEIASKPYLEITEKLMQETGFDVKFQDAVIEVSARQKENIPKLIFNESDWSAAAFYYNICSFLKNKEIQLFDLLPASESVQGDAEVANVFSQLGVQTKCKDRSAQLKQSGDVVTKLEVDFFDKPDLVPALVVACAALGVEISCTGVKNLVVKESNRLVALQNELKKLEANFEKVNDDHWRLTSFINTDLFPTTQIDTYHDHRIAMAFATLGFFADGLTINHPDVVTKSYPQFWDDISSLGLGIKEIH